MFYRRLHTHRLVLGLAAVLLFIAAGPLHVWHVSGATMGQRSLQLSNSLAGVSTTYTLDLDVTTSSTVGSIRAQFCSNNPLIDQSCTAPSGFDISSAVLSGQSGMTGFSIDAADTTANTLILSRTPAPATPGSSKFVLDGVTNPGSTGSYYVRLETYASSDASDSHIDYGGIAFAISDALSVKVTVPPYLLFCTGVTIEPYDCGTASGNYINFGDFAPGHTSTGQTQALVATNGKDGYTIRAFGTTLTSGNNVIPALLTNDVARPGVSQFGFNLRANGTPPSGSDPEGPGLGTVAANYDTPDFYRFDSGEVIASSLHADDMKLYTATYIVNISVNQPPGIYVSTITYVALANF